MSADLATLIEPPPEWSPMLPPRQTSPFAIYAFFAADGSALYVGQTCDMERRFWEHYRNAYSLSWIDAATSCAIIADAFTRAAALAIEFLRINELRPTWNRQSLWRGWHEQQAAELLAGAS